MAIISGGSLTSITEEFQINRTNDELSEEETNDYSQDQMKAFIRNKKTKHQWFYICVYICKTQRRKQSANK